MTEYRLLSKLGADLDIEETFQWYENERQGLGLEFLDELRKAYNRIVDGPFRYQHLRSGIRFTLLKRFPYAVYFVIKKNDIVIVAVLHVNRDPVQWQQGRN